ncbi:hypothetical protein PQU92_05690 [Asticcacaulis sp. BYS171W]|uniref:Uncharacterized protein n=1 Tax=Asticcacaulis aquaticus TaxID=2984212 RepID=A0ABT5HRS8_9CAUL|nr:hypothetical protein [Asticcacaulis aquaticus]MDC7682759.1 hypothetical protein [Asticcacaulis aquaticus]
MKTLVLGALAVCGVMAAGSAFAECDATQEKMVGKAIADVVASETGKVAPAQKEVVDLDRCEGGSSHFDTRFKYKAVMADGKVAWIEGRARGTDDRIEDIRYTRASTELAAFAQGAMVAAR